MSEGQRYLKLSISQTNLYLTFRRFAVSVHSPRSIEQRRYSDNNDNDGNKGTCFALLLSHYRRSQRIHITDVKNSTRAEEFSLDEFLKIMTSADDVFLPDVPKSLDSSVTYKRVPRGRNERDAEHLREGEEN